MTDANPKNKAVIALIAPQVVILLISIIWILLFPKDNIIKYLDFNFTFIVYGIILGVVLAFSGYGFYKIAKRFKDRSKAFENLVYFFEFILSPFISSLGKADVILVSCISGFCEEVLFRGLLTAKFGMFFPSIAFGLMHVPASKDGKVWIYAIWATISGLILAFSFLHFSNLWITITAHVLNNIIGMNLLKRLKV